MWDNWSESGAVLVMEDTEKRELFNAFFASIFGVEDGHHEPQLRELRE